MTWLYRNSETYPTPTLSNGIPQNWEPSSVNDDLWGRLRVVINGVDRTYFRSKPCQFNSFIIQEPFGDATAQITFPQITNFDNPQTYFPKWSKMSIQKVPQAGSPSTLWSGNVADWNTQGNSLIVTGIGALFDGDRFLRKPVFYDRLESIENHIVTTINYFITYYDWDLTIMPDPGDTGIEVRARGGYEPIITGYIANLLALAQTASAKWTVQCEDRTPVMVQKNTSTTHWTIQAGGRGVKLDLTCDHYSGKVNQFYGEGIDDANCHWRNTRYMYDYSQALVWPILSTLQTESFTPIYDPSNYHKILGWQAQPAYDPSIPRFEAYVNFGSGANKTVATNVAIERSGRFFNNEWIGRITLESDPKEGHKFEIRGGHNILVEDFHGSDLLLHISEAAHSIEGDKSKTVLTVDQGARDHLDAMAIYKRNKEALEDPRSKLQLGRRSRQTEDRIPIWDCESGAGVIPTFPFIQGGYYTEFPILAAEFGQIVRSTFQTSPAVEFEIQVFDRYVDLNNLVAIGVGPSEDAYWDNNMDYLESLGLLIGWQHGGYYPGTEGDTLTGKLQDDAAWYYASTEPPFLYVVVSTLTTTQLTGRFHPSGEFEGAT